MRIGTLLGLVTVTVEEGQRHSDANVVVDPDANNVIDSDANAGMRIGTLLGLVTVIVDEGGT